jgi:hypothetical protein
MPLEELGSQMLLEELDVPADRSGADIQLGGGAREALVPASRFEGAQGVERGQAHARTPHSNFLSLRESYLDLRRGQMSL